MSTTDALDRALDAHGQDPDLPMILAGLWDRDGTRYLGARGTLDRSSGEAATPAARFALASMTKPLATVAVLQQVEAGTLELEAPMTAYLPGRSLELMEMGDDGSLQRRAPARAPTLHELLTHSSGFSYEFLNGTLLSAVQAGAVPSLFADPVGGLEAPLVFEPGSAWGYGIGIDIAGQILETVLGEGLDAILAKQLFEPLGMTQTSFNPDETGMAKVHVGEGQALQGLPPAPQHPSGGAGLFSTLEDYGRFLRALLQGGELDGQRILSEAMMARLGANQIAPLAVTPMTSVLPAMSQDSDMGFGSEASWSYGFLRHEGPGDHGRQAGSLSWAGLFNSYFWLDGASGLAGVWATQRLPFCHPAAIAGLCAFERAAYGR